ncbi:DUF6412 domain-containing protein [Micromonospora robiginosa]|uniref:DUF6412 domain-containing protein n=1 Tax=Micromonospora robiginosa TaxID=2749844 RepID=A0A7L6BDZ4_9ACTN|nr:DUF6412 domain-containing protein [Micromonospora ferruginea]QLQ40173.1 DUF6412 domain-containing protein [Micromonospora ferruginea]
MLGLLTGPWAYALALVADRPAGLLAGAAVAAALLLATVLALRVRALPTPPGARHAASVRARARSRRMPRQVDPDAPGRPRPRAPGLRSSAA